MSTQTRHRASTPGLAPFLATLAVILAVTALGMWAVHGAATVPVYAQDRKGDHYVGRYVCTNTSSGDVACQDLPADLGPYVQCRLRPDGPNSQPFVRCANHPDSNRFEEVK